MAARTHVGSTSPRAPRAWVLAAALAIPLALVISACGGSDADDPATAGPIKQATEKLHDFGLTTEQAECIVDEIGAETVVEAADLNAFTESQQYQDAAESCT